MVVACPHACVPNADSIPTRTGARMHYAHVPRIRTPAYARAHTRACGRSQLHCKPGSLPPPSGGTGSTTSGVPGVPGVLDSTSGVPNRTILLVLVRPAAPGEIISISCFIIIVIIIIIIIITIIIIIIIIISSSSSSSSSSMIISRSGTPSGSWRAGCHAPRIENTCRYHR